MHPKDNPLRWHGRRKGKPLRAHRVELVETLLPKLRIDPATPGPWTGEALFGRPVREIWLEVGFGSGEHLIEQAKANPDVGIIGCEAYLNGVAALLAHVERDGVDNVRIYDDDVRHIWEKLPDGALGRIFVLFPDPWPKFRHRWRRMIQPAHLDVFARLLKKGGMLRVATDDVAYMRWSIEHLIRHPFFQWTAERADDWRIPPADWYPTRYETKAKKQGRKCVYLTFLKGREPDDPL